MSAPWLLLDLLLVAGMLGLASASLLVRDGLAMIALFIVFGVVVALAWARLGAPDVALAEAAVGAGVTGVLLLTAWRHLEARRPARAAPPPPEPGERGGLAVAALAALVTAALAAALLALPRPGPGLEEAVAEALPRSGVENPVTAVLLNLRAYDTLLEIAVLFAAVAVVWLGEARPARPDPTWPDPTWPEPAAPAPAFLGPVFLGFARLALPAMVVVGGYLLWIGAYAPGGAFQGGAVLGAAGIVLMLGRLYAPRPAHLPWTRLALAFGCAAFAGAAVLTVLLGGEMLQYPEGAAKAWILVIEASLTLSIAATLAALVLGGVPGDGVPGDGAPGRDAR